MEGLRSPGEREVGTNCEKMVYHRREIDCSFRQTLAPLKLRLRARARLNGHLHTRENRHGSHRICGSAISTRAEASRAEDPVNPSQ